MTVESLIEKLQNFNPAAEVVIPIDEEGSEFSELEFVEGNAIFLKGWEEIRIEKLTEEYETFGFTPSDVYDPDHDPEGVPAVILWH